MDANQIAERAVEKFTYRYTITEQGKQMLLGFILAAIEKAIDKFIRKNNLGVDGLELRAATDDTKRYDDLSKLAQQIVEHCEGREPADSSDSIAIEAVWIKRLRHALSQVAATDDTKRCLHGVVGRCDYCEGVPLGDEEEAAMHDIRRSAAAGNQDDTKRLDWLEANQPQWAGYLTMWSGTIREAIDAAKKEGRNE